METNEVSKDARTQQKVQLVKGEFTPSEASFVINALLDEKINFHKIQRLQNLEGNHNCETSLLDGRIEELEQEKRISKEFITAVRGQGRKLKIDGILKISIAE